MSHDLDYFADMAERAVTVSCREYLARCSEPPMAARFTAEAVDEAIQQLQDARILIVRARQKRAA